LIDIDKGEVTLIKSALDWQTRFPTNNYPIKATGIELVKETFLVYYKKTDYYGSHKERKVTLAGAAFVKWLVPFLARLDAADYWFLASVITTEFLNVVVDKSKAWKPVMYLHPTTQKPVLMAPTESLYIPSDVSLASMGWDKQKLGSPIGIVGPIRNHQRAIVSTSATFRIAHKAMTESQTFRAGHSRGLGFLTSGMGYAGLPSSTTKRLATQLSIILPLLAKGKMVTISLVIGDVPMICKSVEWWSTKDPRILYKNLTCQVAMEKMSTIHTTFKSKCQLRRVENSVFVWVPSDMLPTVKDTDATMTTFDQTAVERLAIVQSSPGEFIYVTQVCSDIYFKHQVYTLGNTWDFRCVVSNMKDLTICGADEEVLSERKLGVIPLPSDLWGMSIRDNGKMCTWLLNPCPSYNNIMNLIRFSPRGGVMALNPEGTWDYCAIMAQKDVHHEEEEDQPEEDDRDLLYGNPEDSRSDEDEEEEEEEEDIPLSNLFPSEVPVIVSNVGSEPTPPQVTAPLQPEKEKKKLTIVSVEYPSSTAVLQKKKKKEKKEDVKVVIPGYELVSTGGTIVANEGHNESDF